MSSSNLKQWNIVAACPMRKRGVLVPYGTNKDNYIVIQKNEDNYIVIQKYNIETNEWNTITTTCKLNLDHTNLPALDTKQNIIYFVHHNYIVHQILKLVQIELNLNNTITNHFILCKNNYDSSSKCISIKKDLFVIGGVESDSISKWNIETKELEHLTTINNKMMLHAHELVYDQNTNSIFIFGGLNHNILSESNDRYSDQILQYNISTQECTKLSIPLPRRIMHVCCLQAINGQYILIFGGCTTGSCYNDIYVYSIKREIMTTSTIKCPAKSIFGGIVVNNRLKDEKCVFGYVRCTWKTCKFSNYFTMPYYLLKIINAYYLEEYVYLLDKITNKHYKMSTLEIV